MVHIGHPGEELAAFAHQLSRRCRVEEAPDGERDGEVVHHRGTTRHGCPPKCDAEATANRVIDAHALTRIKSIAEPAGNPESETLIGALGAETPTDRLQAVDLSGTIGLPAVGNHVG